MIPLDIFSLGTNSKSNVVNAAELVNLYLEQSPDGRKSVNMLPGSEVFFDFGSPKIRGMIVVNDKLYVVHRSNFYRVEANKTVVKLGTLNTFEGKVELANNGDQIFIATGVSGYVYTISTNTFTLIIAAGYPQGYNAAFNSGFFIAVRPDTMQFFVSQLYTGLGWDALDFASAEQNPDNLTRVMVNQGMLVLFGSVSIEFWTNSGGALFPYSSLGTCLEYGLAARESVSKFDNTLTFLARSPVGGLQIVRLSGYTPQRISNTDIEDIINKLDVVSDATSLSYLYEGHAFYQISFPTAGLTLLFDVTSNIWSKVVSPGRTMSRFEQSISWLGSTYLSDIDSGKLFVMKNDMATEDNVPIRAEIVSKHVTFDGKIGSINGLQLNFENGVGTVLVDNPQISLSVSRDYGKTYGPELYRKMGATGEYLTNARWTRLGSSRQFTFRMSMNDGVKRVLVSGFLE